VFVQSLLFLGSKSFSHSFAAIAKFHPTFKVFLNALNSSGGQHVYFDFSTDRTHCGRGTLVE
jgi:hypothetical protein